MQSIEFVTNVVLILVSTFFGGLITKYVIRALEIKERERVGDFLAIIYLRAARDHIAHIEESGISAMVGGNFNLEKSNIVNGLIQAAAKSKSKYREKVYNIAKSVSRTNIEDRTIYVSSSKIHSMIEEMESSYFKLTSNNEEE